MSTPYRVQRGDTLYNIAKQFGFPSWVTIYHHDDNAGYRRFRPNPNLIYVGDVIQIPDGGHPPGDIPRDPKIRTITDEPKCCTLAYADQECPYVGDKKNFKCPPGYYKTSWPCTEGTRTVYCGECANQPEDASHDSCYSYPIACSIWYE